MAGYKFTDQENKEFTLLDDGDYPLEVVGYAFGVSGSGADQVKLKLSPLDPALMEVPKGAPVFQDMLTLSERAAWRADTFLKSAGIVVPVGADVEFDPSQRKRPGCFFVDLRGLRFWARVGREESEKQKGKFFQKVVTFYTNKEKIPKRDYPPFENAQGRELAADGTEIPF
jgi:hypothetical protein